MAYSSLSSVNSVTNNSMLSLMGLLEDKLEKAGSSNTSEGGSDASGSSSSVSEFKDVLSLMIPMMTLSSMGSSGSSSSLGLSGSDSGSSSSFGVSMNSLIAPMMMTLMEKLLSKVIQSDGESDVAETSTGISDAAKNHINQFDAEIEIGGDGINSNCGPTSLVMALHSLGLSVAGETSNMSAGEVVDLARVSMVEDPSRDGVSETGQRSEAEHNAFTNFDDLMNGARAAGASAKMITPNSEAIQEALEDGKTLVVSGTFTGKSPVPWTGDRGVDDSSAPGGATKHLIAVTGYNEKNETFIVNDPARNTPLEVSAEQLEDFMDGNPGALALEKITSSTKQA